MDENRTSDFTLNMTGVLNDIPEAGIILGAYCIFADIISAVENIVLLFVIWQCKDLHTPSLFYVVSISVGDLIFALLLQPIVIGAIFLNRWPGGAITCAAFGYLSYVIAAQSLITYAIISRDRYVACCKPLSYKTSWIHRKYKIFIILGWIYSLAICSPPLYGWGEYVLERGSGICALDWTRAKSTFDSLYPYFLGVALYYPCSIVTLVHYVIIIREMRRFKLGYAERNQQRERKVAQTIGIAITVFTVCYAFYVYARLVEKHIPSNAVDALLWSKLKLASSLLFITQQFLNPLVYGMLNTQFRVELIAMFKQFSCFKGNNLIPPTGTMIDTSGGPPGGAVVENEHDKRTVYLITLTLDS